MFTLIRVHNFIPTKLKKKLFLKLILRHTHTQNKKKRERERDVFNYKIRNFTVKTSAEMTDSSSVK